MNSFGWLRLATQVIVGFAFGGILMLPYVVLWGGASDIWPYSLQHKILLAGAMGGVVFPVYIRVRNHAKGG